MKIKTFALTVVGITVTTLAPAMANHHQMIPLGAIASKEGMQYRFDGSEEAVSLTRGKLVITVRPGDPLYDVNDQRRSVEGKVPEVRNNDVYVSCDLAKAIKRLAHMTPADPMESMATKNTAMRMSPPVKAEETKYEPVSKLGFKQSDAQTKLDVSGVAGPNNPVLLTVSALYAKDIPRVIISRTIAVADENGNFSAKVPYASATFQQAVLEVFATTNAVDAKPMRKTLVIKRLLDNSNLPIDEDPKGIK